MTRTGQMASRSGQVFTHHLESLRSVPLHSHRESALIVSLSGTATVVTPERAWAVSAREMLFLAGGVPHEAHTTADHRSLTIAFAEALVPRVTGWIEASGFVHDLIARIGEADPDRRDRLTAVLVDELAAPPLDPIARAMELVFHRPMPVAVLAREVGMSERTFRRQFQAQVGTTFTAWHQRELCDRAMAKLRAGSSVKSVAASFGYTASAFVAMFKRVTGATPASIS